MFDFSCLEFHNVIFFFFNTYNMLLPHLHMHFCCCFSHPMITFFRCNNCCVCLLMAVCTIVSCYSLYKTTWNLIPEKTKPDGLSLLLINFYNINCSIQSTIFLRQIKWGDQRKELRFYLRNIINKAEAWLALLMNLISHPFPSA